MCIYLVCRQDGPFFDLTTWGRRRMVATGTLLVACSLLHSAGGWAVPSRSNSPSRRDAVKAAVASVATGCALPLPVFAAGKPAARSAAVLQEQLVLILRVQEATAQETRLVQTGKYKELQRLNVKRAISFMLDNYDLRDRFVTASAFAPLSQQQQATEYAQTAVESLIQILEYFPDKLTANDLTSEQKKFVLSALDSTSRNIDSFLLLMPAEVVEGSKAQVLDENRANSDDFDEIKQEIVNVAPAKRATAPPEAPPDQTPPGA